MRSALKSEHFFINLLLTIIDMQVKQLQHLQVLLEQGPLLLQVVNKILELKKKFSKKELLICTINVILFVNVD